MNGKSEVTVVPVCPQKSTTDWSKTGGRSNNALPLVATLKQNTRHNEGLSSRRKKCPSKKCCLNVQADKKTRHFNNTLHSRHCTALGPDNKDKHGNVWVSLRCKIISGMEYVP